MNKIKRLAGDTVLYGLGNIVPRFLNFLLFPFHTNVFKPEEYGVFTYLMSMVAVLNIVYTFGMETAYFRFATKPGADANKVFNVAMTAVAAISLLLSLALLLAAPYMAISLGAGKMAGYIAWLVAIMFIDGISTIPFAKLRLEKKALEFALYKILNVVVLVGLNFFFLFVIYDPAIGIAYVFLANLIANSLYLIFFAKTLLRWRPALDRKIFVSMTRYAYPVMLTGLAGMTNEFFSRISLEKWLPHNFYPGKSSAHAIGVFGACYRFSVLMNLSVQAFRMAAEPFFFSNASDKNSPQLFARVNHYFIIVCCFILLAVSLHLDVLKYLMNKAYWDGLGVVPPLLLGYLFLGVYYNFSVWFKLTDKTYYGTILTACGAVITMALNYMLIPISGYMGSSWATAIVYGSMMVSCYFLGQKYFPVPYPVARGLSYILLTFGLAYAVAFVSPERPFLSMAFHEIVLLAWLSAVYFLERKKWQQTIS